MTTKPEVFQRLKLIVERYLPEDVDPSKITMESNFIEELNINSSNLVDIVLDVEDEFDIILENDDMDGMQTLEDALNIVTQKTEER